MNGNEIMPDMQVIPVIDDPKRLVRRHKKMIVGIATRPGDP